MEELADEPYVRVVSAVKELGVERGVESDSWRGSAIYKGWPVKGVLIR